MNLWLALGLVGGLALVYGAIFCFGWAAKLGDRMREEMLNFKKDDDEQDDES